jgi:hypothetical protein
MKRCPDLKKRYGIGATDVDRLEAAHHYLDHAGVVPDGACELHDLAVIRAPGLAAARS